MVRHFVVACSIAAAAVVACQVYDPTDLVGNGAAGASSGGTGVGATGGIAGLGGTATSGNGGTAGEAGSSVNLEGGAGGEEASGGTAGSGGITGGTGGQGGTSSAGASGTGGAGGTGGGSGTGGAGGTGGATAGTSGAGAGGTGGTSGSSGAGAGGAGAGGAGAGGAGAGGAAGGSAGMAGGTVVELTGTATASSSENTTSQMHPAAHGNDNDPATRWCAANGNTGHYWQVDLAAVHELTRFEVTWEYPTQAVGLFYLYAIGISDDGTTFTTVIDKTANTDATATQSVDFPAGTMARHVRISIPGLPTGAWASFWEASVFGY